MASFKVMPTSSTPQPSSPHNLNSDLSSLHYHHHNLHRSFSSSSSSVMISGSDHQRQHQTLLDAAGAISAVVYSAVDGGCSEGGGEPSIRRRTVDDVWREIVLKKGERKECKVETSDEMITLEDFLAKTGAGIGGDEWDHVVEDVKGIDTDAPRVGVLVGGVMNRVGSDGAGFGGGFDHRVSCTGLNAGDCGDGDDNEDHVVEDFKDIDTNARHVGVGGMVDRVGSGGARFGGGYDHRISYKRLNVGDCGGGGGDDDDDEGHHVVVEDVKGIDTNAPCVGVGSGGAGFDGGYDHRILYTGLNVGDCDGGGVFGNGVGIGGVEVVGERGKRRGGPILEPLDKASQQRQRRMIKNRESANRSRERKQAYQVELESLAAKLEEENEQLQREKVERAKERYRQLMGKVIPVLEKRRPPRLLKRVHSLQW